MNIEFSEKGWEEYIQWQSEDKRTLRKINDLIRDIRREGLLEGIGRPEQLKGIGAYSRHIDKKNRLVYKSGQEQSVIILSCKGHYEDK
jgi:toxin YoeB